MSAKSILIKVTLLAFPDFTTLTKPSHVNTEASDMHLGARGIQDSKLLDFYTQETGSCTIVLHSGS